MTEKSSASDMSEVKILEAAKAARRVLNKLDSNKLTARQMGDLLTLVSKETSTLKAWIHALSQIESIGARAFIRSNPTAASAVGLDTSALMEISDELGNDRDPWAIEKLRRQYVDDVRIQFQMKMSSLDQLSQLGAMSLDDERDSEEWQAVSSDVWTSWGRKGAIGVITGGVKTGKTAIALKLAEYFLAKDFVVVSNIAVANAPAQYHYSARLSDLLAEICRSRLKDKEVITIMDEAGLYFHRAETIHPTNMALAKLTVTLGKLHSCLLMVTHYQEMIARTIAQNSVFMLQKRSHTEVFVEVNAGIRIHPRLLRNVPNTSLSYSPDQLQFFSVDLDVSDLFNFLSTIHANENQWESTLRYLQSRRGEADENAPQPKDVARFLRSRGLSEKKIAEAIGKAPSTVHLWVSEKKD